MNFLTRFSLKNALAVFIVSFLLIVGGLYSFYKLKMDMLPDMDVPALVVQVLNPGATAGDMEDLVNRKIEPQIKSMSALDTFQTTSADNFSFFVVQFDFGTDMEKKEKELKDILEKIELPTNATSEVSRFTMGSIPIVNATLKSKGKQDVQELINSQIHAELENVEGINDIQYFGRSKDTVNIQLSNELSFLYGISMPQVKEAIEKNAIGMPMGTIKEDSLNIPVRLEKPAEDLMNLEFKTITGEKVKLSDFATLKKASLKTEIGRFNGEDVVAVSITKTQDANTVEVTEKIISVLESHSDDLSYNIVFDQASNIKLSVKTLVKEGLFGALFASITILLFLRSVRATLISVVSIPLSLLITGIFLHRLGITLNMMTLGAMAVAVGRVVDDSIVVIENIYRRMSRVSQGGTKDDEIILSTKEILGAITSSTITTAVVFLPIGLVGGMSGEIFLPFALTVVISLFASLLVAVTIVPILAKLTIKEKAVHQENKVGSLEKLYIKVIKHSLNHKIWVLVSSVLLLFASFAMVSGLGFTLIPNDKQKMLSATITLPSGTAITKTNELSLGIEKLLKQNDMIKDTTALIGMNSMGFGESQENIASYFILLSSDADIDKESIEIKAEMEKKLPDGSKIMVQNMTSGGMPNSNALTIDIYNDNLEHLQSDASKVAGFLKEKSHVKNIENNFEEQKTQYVVVLDNESLRTYGIDSKMAMMIIAGQMQNLSFPFDNQNITISYDKGISSQKDLEKIFLIGEKGVVPLSSVAEVKKAETFTNIQKLDGKTFARISAELNASNIKQTTEQIEKDLHKKLTLHKNSEMVIGGGSEDAVDAFMQLGMAMLVAVGLVYLTMLITFKKARIPFIILSSLIFVPIGAFGGLFLTGEPLSISVMIGILMLIGIVTTNAIVFVDRVGQNIDNKKMKIREALIDAGKTRLRPILMTAFATVTALLPLAMSTSSGTLISKGLAIVVIGGLTTSTLLTLILVPVLYELFFFKKSRKERSELSDKLDSV